ncbi:MAG: MFS transporter [Chloroflexi bacterium]|nr:MFS transporter [Chloroflexota bacterium]
MPDLSRLAVLRHLAVDRNERNFLGESTWTGVAGGLATSFMPVLALRWGASPFELAVLTAMPYLIYTFFSIPAGHLFERAKQRATMLAVCTLLWRSNYFFIALLPWVWHDHLVWVMIAIITLSILPASVNSVAIFAALGDLTEPGRRSWVIGMRRSVISLTTALATLCGGWLLTRLPFPSNYQIVLMLAFIAGLISVFHLSRLDYSAPSRARATVSAAATSDTGALTIRSLLRDYRPFCLFSLGAFLFTGGYYMANPLFPLYQVKTLGANEAWVGVITMAQQATMFVSFLLWARIGQRFGMRFTMCISTSAWCLVGVAMALTTNLPQLVPVAIWHGCFFAGWNFSVYLGLFEVCPEERRPSFIGIYSAFGSLLGFVCPLIGAQLVQLYGIHLALMGTSLFSATGALVYLINFPIRRPKPALEQG